MGVLGLELSGIALFLGIGGEWMKGDVKVQGGREEPDRRVQGIQGRDEGPFFSLWAERATLQERVERRGGDSSLRPPKPHSIRFTFDNRMF